MSKLKEKTDIYEKLKKEEPIMEKRRIYNGMTENEVMKLLNELQGEAQKLKAHLKLDEKILLGDCRTDRVKNGNYEHYYKGNCYIMDSFTGFVKDMQYLPQTRGNVTRAKLLMELKNGKRLSFFTWVDNTIKINTIIEAVGICLKEGLFYNFKCYGGIRRVMSPIEIDQYVKGKKFENLELLHIPLEMLSKVKETKPIEEVYIPSLTELELV